MKNIIRFIAFITFIICPQTTLAQQNRSAFREYRIGIQAGLASRLWIIDDSYNLGTLDYLGKQRFGSLLGANISFSIDPNYNLGVQYRQFYAHKESVLDEGLISNEILISFIGPFVSINKLLDGRHHSIYLNAGVGYLAYKDYSALSHTEKTGRGGTSGTSISFGYEYHVTPCISLTTEINGIFGYLYSMRVKENDSISMLRIYVPESMIYLSASIGMVLSFGNK